MFFFFFDELEELKKNRIIQKTFDILMFKKIYAEGYCDINPILGKPRLTKSEIANNLRRIKSPLDKLYLLKYATTPQELETVMLPFLQQLEDRYQNEQDIEEYNYFAIAYFIFQTYKETEQRVEFLKSVLEKNNESCDLKISNGIVYDASQVEINFISTIDKYINFLKDINSTESKIFFRGHSKISYELQPSLFRNKKWLNNEKKMYLELMAKCPFEFEKLNTHIGKLAEMQHYGLPTRLLDITQNPLVALYFACESQGAYRGEVIIFEELAEDIKYTHSDTVALLASLPLFTKTEQDEFYELCRNMPNSQQKLQEGLEKLVHEVKLERPGFKPEIEAADIRDLIFCIPEKKNRRIDNQEGAFIVCGLLDEVYGDQKGNSLSTLRIRNKDDKKIICIIDQKEDMLQKLELLGINKAKIYPEIDDVADYIKTHI